jgi:nicotinate-nucleotide adenylyltransferase
MNSGFLGGTFDPPHLGHAVLAQEALERFSLDTVFFVPSRNPPHKGMGVVSPFSVRKEMLSISISRDPRFQLLDLEPPDAPSYTVNLVKRLTDLYGGKPCLILGMDSLVEMPLWHQPELLLRLARVVVGTRPGVSPEILPEGSHTDVTLFDFPGVCISSSDIRRRVSQGRSIRYLVTRGVRSYIREKGLYGSEQGH